MLAVQGPQAKEQLAAVFPDAAAVGRFHVGRGDVGRSRVHVRRHGLHGRGAASRSPSRPTRPRRCGTAIVAAGIAPAGLGARDTLRLEAALPLHGHELGPGITPLQAGLGWVVAWNKERVPRP